MLHKEWILNDDSISISKFWEIIAIITLIGGILRIVYCFWGYPLHLHVDEPTIVNNTIDMLARHSWEAFVYNRPDQFEIKCNALWFTIVSWLKFNAPAYVVFKTHEFTFYLTARIYTSLFGTALIPLVAVVTGKIAEHLLVNKKIVQLSCVLLVAFSTIFVSHSAYSTPDIPLTFFIVLFTYVFIEYIEKGGFKRFSLNCVIIGVGITIKYPAAILCLPLAFMVIYRKVSIEKDFTGILKYGIKGVLIICAVVFIIAPNLFTNVEKVYSTIILESRPNHLGADGLGFAGNFLFYLRNAIENLGWESAILGCLGIYTICKADHIIPSFSFGIGILYWICMSVLSLHWQRWGIPVFCFYIMIVSIGIGKVADYLLNNSKCKKFVFCIGRIMLPLISILVIFNVVISGIAITRCSLLKDVRVVTLEWCNKNRITPNNTLYHEYGYSPFATLGSGNEIAKSFELRKEKLVLKDRLKSKKYVMYSASLRNLYLREEKKYRREVKVFKTIEKEFPLIYKLSADGNYWKRRTAIENIPYSLDYLFKKSTTTGSNMYIYKIR